MDQNNVINMIRNSENLPPIPKDFGTITQMFSMPSEYDMDQCVEYLSRYPKLETFIIQELNYGSKLHREIQTLKEAINYLGAKNSSLITIAYITRLLLPNKNGRTKLFNRVKYWKH